MSPSTLRGAPRLVLVALVAVAACAGPEAADSPPGGDAGYDAADAAVAADALLQADGRPDAPQGACQLTTQERDLGAVPTGAGQQALGWDGSRLAAVYQVQPSSLELRFAASDAALNPLGPVATFTQPLVDCALAVGSCHAAPALWVDGASAFTVVWAGYDPPHGAVGLHFGRLDGNGTLSGHQTPVAGAADPVSNPDLRAATGGYAVAWQQGPVVRAAALDAAGAATGAVAVSSPAETAERPRVAVVGTTTAVLYTWKTGAAASRLVVRLQPAGGEFGAELPLELGLSRPRGVALLEVGGDLVVVLEAEAPAGHGWNAAYVARLDATTGALLAGPAPALLAGAVGGVVVDSAMVTNVGDVAIGATVYDAAAAHAVLQRVNRWGQGLHPEVDVSAGHPSIAPLGMSTQVAWLNDRFAVSYVAASSAGAGTLYLRTVTCDF